MPALLKAAIMVVVFIAPVIVLIYFLVRWQNKSQSKHLQSLAAELGLKAGTSIGNRLFDFPSALGEVDGYPVWIGTVSNRRRDNPSSRYILFQIVVGKERGAPLTAVGPHHLDDASTSVPYATVEKEAAKVASLKDMLAGRTGMLDGGKELEVTDSTIVRTFAIQSLTSAKWVNRVAASTRVMAAYAHVLEERAKKIAA